MPRQINGGVEKGKLDTLAYQLAKGLCGIVEANNNPGLTTCMMPFIEKGIRSSGLGKVKLPEEITMIGEMIFGKGE